MPREITEFRLHGRGGQGIVVAASIFAEAVFLSGNYARAFSLFGAERRGAPVTAFIRIGPKRLMPRSRIYNPEYVVVFDATISGQTLFAGLQENGNLIINADDDWLEQIAADDLDRCHYKVFRVKATEIAWENKLTIGSFPMVNTVMLGAMAKVSGLVNLEHLTASIKKRVSASLDANVNATAEGYASVKEVACLAVDR
jgi:2-oxoisovalerate/pyruvate ferredoxin oxidoreductase gamma subunit